MAENENRVLSIRLPEELARQIERDASGMESSASAIIRAIITQHYQRRDGETAAVRALSAELRALGERLDERFWQLMYEHSRNRNSLFGIALAPVRDEQALRAILKDSKESARRWVEQCRKSELRNNGSQPESGGLKE
jgi:predicted transcriptional regulator